MCENNDMPAGRPSIYTEELGISICTRIADGESLRHICETPGMPDRHTVIAWSFTNPSFSAHYAQAREIQIEETQANLQAKSMEALSLVQTCENPKLANAMVQAIRLEVDTAKWIASKLLPKKYGDKVEQVHSGEVGIKRIMVPDRITPPTSEEPKPEFS